eukprot:IDg6301t1
MITALMNQISDIEDSMGSWGFERITENSSISEATTDCTAKLSQVAVIKVEEILSVYDKLSGMEKTEQNMINCDEMIELFNTQQEEILNAFNSSMLIPNGIWRKRHSIIDIYVNLVYQYCPRIETAEIIIKFNFDRERAIDNEFRIDSISIKQVEVRNFFRGNYIEKDIPREISRGGDTKRDPEGEALGISKVLCQRR